MLEVDGQLWVEVREPRNELLKVHEFVRLNVRKWSQKDSVDQRKNCVGGADSERHRKNGNQCERRFAMKRANQIADVLRDVFEFWRYPFRTHRLAGKREVAEVPAGRATRLFG